MLRVLPTKSDTDDEIKLMSDREGVPENDCNIQDTNTLKFDRYRRLMEIIIYLDVPEVASRFGGIVSISWYELSSDASTAGAELRSSVNSHTVDTSFKTKDSTTNFDGTGNRCLFQHNSTTDVLPFDVDQGLAWAFDRHSTAASHSEY